ncbi:MAG: hypothetical protein IT306_29515 [Chloroflexi bacterium]|nr:hypothetical protein [Chloroflexota bacterium]
MTAPVRPAPTATPEAHGAASADGTSRRAPALPPSPILAACLDWWPLIALAVVAFAIRWPNLWYIPQFTDEVFDAQVAYSIWEGKRPLTGVNAYTGALFYYLLAGVFWLFGPSIYMPRLFVLVLGVVAVVVTGLLGADLGRRAALRAARPESARTAGWIGALVGGGLLGTNGVHVLTNSHLSWPHCTLLLYLTLAFWLLERAVSSAAPTLATAVSSPTAPSHPSPPTPDTRHPTPASGWALVGAGFCFGLAQQQHPTMLLLWPVFIGYVLVRGWRYFLTRWAYLALVGFVVGVSPLIVYNLTTDFGTFKESVEQTSNYQEGRTDDLSYRGRVVEIAQTAPRVAATAFDLRPAPLSSYLLSPTTWVYTVLGVAGLVMAARLGAWSLPLAVVTFLVLLPAFPASHDQLPRQARYLMPLFPLIFAGVGGLAVWAWLRVGARRPALRPLVLALLAVLVLYPLVPLARYERDVLAANETNDRYFVTLGAMERQRRPQEPVVLDPTLQNDRTGAAGTAQRTFDFMMELRGIRRATLKEANERIVRELDVPTAIVVADDRVASFVDRSGAPNRANAETWSIEQLPNDDGGGFTIWRITRR